MKTIRLTTLGVMASFLLLAACQRNVTDELISVSKTNELVSVNNKEANPAITSESQTVRVDGTQTSSSSPSAPSAPCNPNAYIITLESHVQIGDNWEWIWSVQNSNPGNGNNGTVQDLSNWGMQFGTCVNFTDVVAAAYSNDGSTWTGFTPSYGVDPSQSCLTTPVLKFDYGTTGSAKTYYRLTLSHNYAVGISSGYYKSGTHTGCCTFNFAGISCDDGGGPR